ncbi:MAG: DUF4276 family protein [Pirellulaceae bacterium]|nr:DUF4276 family protein [Pirellulaceae bacterium]
MNELRFTLTTDGSFDRVLLNHLTWIMRDQLGNSVALQSHWADMRSLRKRPKNLAEKIRLAVELYPCDLLFIHRDAEKSDASVRYEEIRSGVREAGIRVPYVPVMPVRMTEAWLLLNEQALRSAAGNPNGRADIGLPVSSPEDMPDPKGFLHNALRTASELKGRRLRDFKVVRASHRVAEYIDDYSLIRTLPSFARLEEQIAKVLKSI